MISAVGYSENDFSISDPGRLCRGRERWIEPWVVDEPPEPVFRGVISGAQFEDDSARDALRGVQHSGLDLVSLLVAVLKDAKAIAFMEDGHPADMPAAAEHIEAYTGYRYGGARHEALVRWSVEVKGRDEIADLLGPDIHADRVRGFAVPRRGADTERLRELLFLLTGMSTLDSPPARYQPIAIPEVLEEATLLVLLHRDKHGPAVGIYAAKPVDVAALVSPLAAEVSALVVPFAIPPMLARWDRALAELRGRWDEEEAGPFPVPQSPEGSGWEVRGRRRRRRKDKDEHDEVLIIDDGEDLDDVLIIEDGEDLHTSPDGVLELDDDDDSEEEDVEDGDSEETGDFFEDGVLEIGD